jgi:hypothetical protein
LCKSINLIFNRYLFYSIKIVVARRWFDDTIELVNTEVEFDDSSLQEFQRNHLQMVHDIEANLKLFINTRWQHAKKFTLPFIFDFDERQEVAMTTMAVSCSIDSFSGIDMFKNARYVSIMIF